MGRYFGYHRTSTTEQHLERGLAEIETFCKKNDLKTKEIVTDQCTGKNFNRPGYTMLKRMVDEGDTLIITEVDRLGRNKADTMKELRWFQEHNVRLMILELPTTTIDFSSMDNEMGKLMLETTTNMLIELYVSLAEAEMHKREKRQREGLEELRKSGNWDKMGRPRKMSQSEFNLQYARVVDGEISPFKLMKELGLTKSTYYNYKKAYDSAGDWIKQFEIE